MARWVLSPWIGDGSTRIVTGQELTTGPWRPRASLYASAWTLVGPGAEDGTPARNWCLIRATAGDLVAAEADTELTVFPDLQLDDVLTLAQRNWLITKVSALGEPTGWITAGLTVREALRTIGRRLEANFELPWIGETD